MRINILITTDASCRFLSCRFQRHLKKEKNPTVRSPDGLLLELSATVRKRSGPGEKLEGGAQSPGSAALFRLTGGDPATPPPPLVYYSQSWNTMISSCRFAQCSLRKILGYRFCKTLQDTNRCNSSAGIYREVAC